MITNARIEYPQFAVMKRNIHSWAFSFLFLVICIFSKYLNPTCAQAVAGKPGVLAGKVSDKSNGELLIGASVFITELSKGTVTDLDGKFSISLDPGTYTVLVRMVGYKQVKFERVAIGDGQTRLLTVNLNIDALETQEVEVIADISKNNENALIEEQKQSSSIGSGISAELLAKTPDRSMAESFRRISSTSIRDGKFAMVRGLNERYNQGMLNGIPITSTEPDRKAFSLEIFPSNLIDKVVVAKSISPDMPGDVAGGLVKIQTIDIPYSNSFTATIGGETHSLTTFKPYSQLKGSSTDWLGFDNGFRDVPKGILNRQQAELNPNEQLKAEQSTAFNHNYVPGVRNASPNGSFQISLGRRGNVFGKTAGLVASVNYYRTFLRNEFSSIFIQPSGENRKSDYDSTHQDRFRTSTNLSAVLNMSIKPSATTKVFFRNFLSQNASDQLQLGNFKNIANGGVNIVQGRSTTSYYDQTLLLSNQLGLEKMFNEDGLRVELTVGTTVLDRRTPDLSRLFYGRGGNLQTGDYLNQKYRILLTSGNVFNPSGSGKFFSQLNEFAYAANLNFIAPYKIFGLKHEAKTGLAYQDRAREFQGRNFLYGFGEVGTVTAAEGMLQTLGPDSIFMPEHFAPSLFTLRETTNVSDFYSANVRLVGGYLMNQTNFGDLGSRLIYGLRYESYFQSVTSARANARMLSTVTSTVPDFFPSVSGVWNLTNKLGIRGAYSQTVNRPELRELSPFQFYDPNLNAVVFGSDSLRRAKVENIDFKLEYFPKPGTVFSINWFRKRFTDPIEFLRDPVKSPPFFTYINAYQATNSGIEFELRSSLAFVDSLFNWSQTFSNLSFFGNFSIIRSNVDLIKGQKIERPLQGQSPYIVNLGLDYSFEPIRTNVVITYNRIGQRVAFVAPTFGGLIWERPRDIFDVSINHTYNKFVIKLIFGDILQQDLIQYLVEPAPNRKQQTRVGKFISGDLPNYQEGIDTPFFRFTYGRTIRAQVTYRL